MSAPEDPEVPESPLGEICDDCWEGNHHLCRQEGGYLHEDTPERCACHLNAHALL